MQGKRERPLIAGFIYEVDGFDRPVIPITRRRGGWVFYCVNRDVHGNVFRGGVAPLQPDAAGDLLLEGVPIGRTLFDLRFVAEGDAPGLAPLPME